MKDRPSIDLSAKLAALSATEERAPIHRIDPDNPPSPPCWLWNNGAVPSERKIISATGVWCGYSPDEKRLDFHEGLPYPVTHSHLTHWHPWQKTPPKEIPTSL